MRHLARPVGAGGCDDPDVTGTAGAVACGDAVEIDLRIAGGHVVGSGFRASGCGTALAAASALCERIRGLSVLDACAVSADEVAALIGGVTEAQRHAADLVVDALARGFERWYSDRLGEIGLPLDGRRVAVAMSGGVDSAVAAKRLVEAGYDVVGITMRLWHDPQAAMAERSCCSPETVQLARRTAHTLGVPHITIDASERFRRGVVESFVEGYRRGVTPNPCVTCNGTVRFTILREFAALVAARRLATGHYARIVDGTVARAADGAKDQSYMLARLDRATIDRLELPLGDMVKADVRALARGADLPAADAVESQEVCFVGEGGYVPFMERHAGMSPAPGPIVTTGGTVVGEHLGYWRFTIGQRRGIGVASDGPLYVVGTDAGTNTVTVGTRDELALHALELDDVITHETLQETALEVRVRYGGGALRGRARPSSSGLSVELVDPASGVAPGQTAALYRDGRLVAAGTIRRQDR